jgi:hypothetical protein
MRCKVSHRLEDFERVIEIKTFETAEIQIIQSFLSIQLKFLHVLIPEIVKLRSWRISKMALEN